MFLTNIFSELINSRIFTSAAAENSTTSRFKLFKIALMLKWFSGTSGTTATMNSFLTEEFLACLAATPCNKNQKCKNHMIHLCESYWKRIFNLLTNSSKIIISDFLKWRMAIVTFYENMLTYVRIMWATCLFCTKPLCNCNAKF